MAFWPIWYKTYRGQLVSQNGRQAGYPLRRFGVPRKTGKGRGIQRFNLDHDLLYDAHRNFAKPYCPAFVIARRELNEAIAAWAGSNTGHESSFHKRPANAKVASSG